MADPDLSAACPQMTEAAALAARLRVILAAPEGAALLTYQQAAQALGLQLPGTIQRVAAALEWMMQEDVSAARPMIAARVISRAEGKPRQGFFDCAVELGRFPADPAQHLVAWQAELAAQGL